MLLGRIAEDNLDWLENNETLGLRGWPWRVLIVALAAILASVFLSIA